MQLVPKKWRKRRRWETTHTTSHHALRNNGHHVGKCVLPITAYMSSTTVPERYMSTGGEPPPASPANCRSHVLKPVLLAAWLIFTLWGYDFQEKRELLTGGDILWESAAQREVMGPAYEWHTDDDHRPAKSPKSTHLHTPQSPAPCSRHQSTNVSEEAAGQTPGNLNTTTQTLAQQQAVTDTPGGTQGHKQGAPQSQHLRPTLPVASSPPVLQQRAPRASPQIEPG